MQVLALGQPVKKLYLHPGSNHTCEILRAATLLCSDLTNSSQNSAAALLFLTKVLQSHPQRHLPGKVWGRTTGTLKVADFRPNAIFFQPNTFYLSSLCPQR